MRFGGEMHDVGDGVLLDHAQGRNLVPQIHLLENILGMFGNVFEVGQMSGVGEAVEVDELGDSRIVHDVLDQVRADEASAARDEEIHF